MTMATKEQCEKIIEILKPQPCIIVKQRYETDSRGNSVPYGLTVVEQSSNYNGRGHGPHTRYDYGFMQLDIQNGYAVVVI